MAELLAIINGGKRKRELDLNYLVLRLPTPEIKTLTILPELNLCGNRLKRIPVEIGQLTALTSLNLDCNHRTALPPQIGALPGLTDGFLNGNQLTGSDDEIAGAHPRLIRGHGRWRRRQLDAKLG